MKHLILLTLINTEEADLVDVVDVSRHDDDEDLLDLGIGEFKLVGLYAVGLGTS